jgi:hypothetical protein
MLSFPQEQGKTGLARLVLFGLGVAVCNVFDINPVPQVCDLR